MFDVTHGRGFHQVLSLASRYSGIRNLKVGSRPFYAETVHRQALCEDGKRDDSEADGNNLLLTFSAPLARAA
jgi:hypothetical protein